MGGGDGDLIHSLDCFLETRDLFVETSGNPADVAERFRELLGTDWLSVLLEDEGAALEPFEEVRFDLFWVGFEEDERVDDVEERVDRTEEGRAFEDRTR